MSTEHIETRRKIRDIAEKSIFEALKTFGILNEKEGAEQ